MRLPVRLTGTGNLFMLEVKGDSMIDAAICDGDFVVVREQHNAENGDIVAALLDDEATVKTFRQEHGHTWLIPHNPNYAPIDGTHAQIMGKVGRNRRLQTYPCVDLNGTPKHFAVGSHSYLLPSYPLPHPRIAIHPTSGSTPSPAAPIGSQHLVEYGP